MLSQFNSGPGPEEDCRCMRVRLAFDRLRGLARALWSQDRPYPPRTPAVSCPFAWAATHNALRALSPPRWPRGLPGRQPIRSKFPHPSHTL